jgi:recombinational DNA repair protein RecT
METRIERIKRTEIEKMNIVEIADDERVKTRFVQTYNTGHMTTIGEAFYTQAKESFLRVVAEDQNLRQCTPLSLYSAFLDMATLGINVAKISRPLAYLLWYNINVGTKTEPRWERRAVLEISPYGELSVMQNLGQIKYADNPVIVYEGDEFEELYENGQKQVKYKKMNKSTKIIAGFIKIVRNDGTYDFYSLDLQKMKRLEGYSERKNKQGNAGGEANKLYSSNNGQPDEGFFTAKLIKHAFRAYPRSPKLSAINAQFQTDKMEPEHVEDPYGVDNDVEDVTPTEIYTEPKEENTHF